MSVQLALYARGYVLSVFFLLSGYRKLLTPTFIIAKYVYPLRGIIHNS
jgi:hypothetical protein